MSPTKPNKSALVESSAALESELETWERVVAEGRRLVPTSDKTLDRAKTLLESCANAERKLADHLHSFVTAMQAVQERQRLCMEATVGVAKALQDRIASRQALLDRFAALGNLAAEINEPVSTVMDALTQRADIGDVLGLLDDVVAKTTAIADEARGVAKNARESGWQDIARAADGLEQQIRSVRDKVVSAHHGVAARASS